MTSQFGLQFFTKKNAKSDENTAQIDEKKNHYSPQESLSNQIGGFITRKEKFFTKKVPSPLEKTLGYLNADEDSNSDNESLARFALRPQCSWISCKLTPKSFSSVSAMIC